MRALSLHFPRALRQSFTRAAKKAFPAETIAVCLGTKEAGHLEIVSLYYPENTTLGADGRSIHYDTSVYQVAGILGKPQGLMVLGEVHSHCWAKANPIFDASPSEYDWDSCHISPSSAPIHGICTITEAPSGKVTSRFRFWPKINKIPTTS